jgi:DNA-binding transcriptional MerR regulator
VTVQIPEDKRYFRIGEASRIVGVEPYVLRYWESEFPQIRPRRADSNHLETILEIKRLLYEEKLTIRGAKRRLRAAEIPEKTLEPSLLDDVKGELREIVKMLS